MSEQTTAHVVLRKADSLPALYTKACHDAGTDLNPAVVSAVCNKSVVAGGSSAADREASPPSLLLASAGLRNDDLAMLAAVVRDAPWTRWAVIDLRGSAAPGNVGALALLEAMRARGAEITDLILASNDLRESRWSELIGSGLNAKSLDLSHGRLRQCPRLGPFPHLTSLTLDGNPAIFRLPKGCLSEGAPQLARLSLVGTGIINLWSTCAELERLHCLAELCFQRAGCPVRTANAPSSTSEPPNIEQQRDQGTPPGQDPAEDGRAGQSHGDGGTSISAAPSPLFDTSMLCQTTHARSTAAGLSSAVAGASDDCPLGVEATATGSSPGDAPLREGEEEARRVLATSGAASDVARGRLPGLGLGTAGARDANRPRVLDYPRGRALGSRGAEEDGVGRAGGSVDAGPAGGDGMRGGPLQGVLEMGGDSATAAVMADEPAGRAGSITSGEIAAHLGEVVAVIRARREVSGARREDGGGEEGGEADVESTLRREPGMADAVGELLMLSRFGGDEGSGEEGGGSGRGEGDGRADGRVGEGDREGHEREHEHHEREHEDGRGDRQGHSGDELAFGALSDADGGSEGEDGGSEAEFWDAGGMFLDVDIPDADADGHEERASSLSPICGQQHYRQFMLARLPQLRVLDNAVIAPAERHLALQTYAVHYEPLANGRVACNSMVRLLLKREMGVLAVTRHSRSHRRTAARDHFPMTGPHGAPTHPPIPTANAVETPATADERAGTAGTAALALADADCHPARSDSGERRGSALVPASEASGADDAAEARMCGSESSSMSGDECQVPGVAAFDARERGVISPFSALPVPTGDPCSGEPPTSELLASGPDMATPARDPDDRVPLHAGKSRGDGCPGVEAKAPMLVAITGEIDGEWEWGAGSVAGMRRSMESSLARRVGCPASQVVCPLKYRPRQFEYHPSLPEYMVVGSIAGQVLLVRHVSGQVVAQVDSVGAPHSVLGLCWLHGDAAKLIAGADDGSIQLFDVSAMHASLVTRHRPAAPPPHRPPSPMVTSSSDQPTGAPQPHDHARGLPPSWRPAAAAAAINSPDLQGGAGLTPYSARQAAFPGSAAGMSPPDRPPMTAASISPPGGASGGGAGARSLLPGGAGRRNPVMYTYPEFRHLTSVHINSTDQLFVTSGYSTDVGLYDLGTGQQLQRFQNLHKEHINVVKFSHSAPSIFATSSFDRDIKLWDVRCPMDAPLYTSHGTRGNVMVCFSPDDRHLLVSAIDNEVRQLLACDGRPVLEFDIPLTGGGHNYTRSYYMNGSDYVISGSCEENAVRVLSTHSGKRLRDVTLEGPTLEDSLYVQSLRADPCRPFQFSVLAACNRSTAHSHILKLDLLNEAAFSQQECDNCIELLWGMGA